MNASREQYNVGLSAGQWCVAYEKEEPVGGPGYHYRGISALIQAEAVVGAGGAAAQIFGAAQESDDGVTWITTWVEKDTPLVGGGQLSRTFFHTRRYIRILLWSDINLSVGVTITTPEPSAGISNWPGTATLACSGWCEVDCETGSETAD